MRWRGNSLETLIEKSFLDSFQKENFSIPDLRNKIRMAKGLEEFLDSPQDYFIYTGRGPSDDFHLGHLCSYSVASELQSLFDIPVLFHISELEKASEGRLEMNFDLKKTEKKVLSMGFDPRRTHFFSEREGFKKIWPQVMDCLPQVPPKKLQKYFGTQRSLGSMLYSVIQAIIPVLSKIFFGKQSKPLIVCGEDQLVYFRLTADLFGISPSIVVTEYVDHSQGEKMSHKNRIRIFDDPYDKAKKKLMRLPANAPATLEEHRALGGDPLCNFLKICRLFLEETEYKNIERDYTGGKLTVEEMKNFLWNNLEKKIRQIRNRYEEQ